MAFVRTESWDGKYGRPSFAEAEANAVASLLDVASYHQNTRRVTAVIVSLIVHSLLLWVMATRLAAGIEPAETALIDLGALKTFEVQPQSAVSSPSEPQTVRKPEPVKQAPVTEIEASSPSELPPEWSVSRINQVAEQAPPQQQQSASLTGAAASKGGSGGTAQSDVFDPYAGAAPQRREDAAVGEKQASSIRNSMLGTAALKTFGRNDPELDREALDGIRREVSRAFPLEGTAEFSVRISSAGVVLQADFNGGSVSSKAAAMLRSALIGKRLFRISPAAPQRTHYVKLPMLQLGRS